MAVVFRLPDGKAFKLSDIAHILKMQTVKGFSLGNIFLTALFAGLSHIFIDIRFEPYGFAFYPENVKVSLSVGYGVFMGLGIYYGNKLIAGKKLFWYLWKEFVFWLVLVVLITSVNFAYRYILLHEVYEIYDIYSISFIRFMFVGVEVVGMTALILKFFQTILIKSDMIYAVADRPQTASSTMEPRTFKHSDNYHISINGKNKKERLKLPLDAIAYMHSTGNYVEVYYENGDVSEDYSKVMIRQSLSSVENQLADEDCIVRIHKSYLINKNKLTDVKGNSKKAMLVLNDKTELPLRRDLYHIYKR